MINKMRLNLILSVGFYFLTSFENNFAQAQAQVETQTQTQTQLTISSPEKISEDFHQTKSENERYQFFNQLSQQAEAFSNSTDVKKYIVTFYELIEYSKSNHDADWVYGSGRQLIQQVAGIKSLLIVTKSGVIPQDRTDQEEFLYFFPLTSEAFEHQYVSQMAYSYIMNIQVLPILVNSYDFLVKVRPRLVQPPEYIFREMDAIQDLIAYKYSSEYLNLSETDLALWLPRLNSESMQKLFQSLDDLMISVSNLNGKDQILNKTIWMSKFLYLIIYDKYKNDPFNEWQFKKALRVGISAVVKSEQLDVVLHMADLEFLVNHLSPSGLVDFCNDFGHVVVRKQILNKEQAESLVLAYKYLDQVLKEKKYTIDSSTFNSALTIVQMALVPFDSVEGEYTTNLNEYKKLIIAYKSDRGLVAGIQTSDSYVNLAFQSIDFDADQNAFVGDTTEGLSHYVLRFQIIRDGYLSGCLNERCFKAKRTVKLPNYLSLLKNKNTTIEVAGEYVGTITLEDGKTEQGEIVISKVGGHYVGNFMDGQKNILAFEFGIIENPSGVIYMSTRKLSRFSNIHLFRAVLGSDQKLRGIWLSTTKSFIGEISFKKKS